MTHIHVFDLDGTLLATDHSCDWDNPASLLAAATHSVPHMHEYAEFVRTNGGSIHILTGRRSLAHREVTQQQIQEILGWSPGSYTLWMMPSWGFDWITYNVFKTDVLCNLAKISGSATYYGDNKADRQIAQSAGVSYFDVKEI